MLIKDLENEISKLGIRSSIYSLNEGLKPDCIVLYKNYNLWEVFYLDEKGNRLDLKFFYSEEEACAKMYDLLLEATREEREEVDVTSPWRDTTINDLIIKLQELNVEVKHDHDQYQFSFLNAKLVLRKEDSKWTLYNIDLYPYAIKKEYLMKIYIFEDKMCEFIYKYCKLCLEISKEE